MAESTGTSGFHTLVAYLNDSSPATYTKVSEVYAVGGPGQTVEEIEFTHMESPGNRREFKPSFINGEDLSFSINFKPSDTTHQQLVADQIASKVRSWKVQWPDAVDTTWEFEGFVKTFTPDAPIDNRLSASVTVKPTGDFDLDSTPIE